MKIRSYIFCIQSLFLLISIALFTGCSNQPKLSNKEKAYGTNKGKYAIFHRIAEVDRGLGLKYPGFLVGIEKGYREKIDPNNTYDIVDKLNKDTTSEKNYARVKDILGDRKLTFVSHIAQYSLKSGINGNPYNGIPYIAEHFIHNAYEKDFDSSNVYTESSIALDNLKERIEQIKDNEQYTHIFFYCMGWNTDQQESLRNYNSLLGLIIENYNGERPFKPLFVGITWPSLWKWNFFKYTGIISSYFTKADDADEVGLMWGNRILRDILIPLKKEKNIPLILVGHSLGARALTRALFSSPLVPTELTDSPDDINRSDVDLMIGLEGAFSVRRFIYDKGLEGYPYEKFEEYARKFVFTWSTYDSANSVPVIYGTRYIGGEPGYKYTKKFITSFDHFTIKTNGTDNNYNKIYTGVKDGVKWQQSFGISSKISIVDASELIYYRSYFNGGKAHNDIYTPGIAKFIWSCIDNIQ
ncbi:MAG: hypothetical protein HOI47_22315 [Candidatus Scalindua sp.]|jgi:hypothetical protein|nr:hypothetical protein [Candidatus Scalindua sp.]MBT5305646.1 hypothetical protein [Candidatus Scalindua sp.]MBT6046887.1 hypothetical protein [Candidatus Scalindua sp.]MBT6229388.1 hypothetical protein [Candidatus Scalindua sp.]MBT7212557.1 hypothetical protein [Candidatus Scalindua sp.]